MDTSARLLYALFGIVFLASHTHAQDAEQVSALSQRIAGELSTLHRYDSDITVHSGAWISRFVHIRLDGVESAEVIFLSFDPRLLSQVSEFLRASPTEHQGGSVEFHEYRFPVETCEGLSGRIEDLKSALRDSVGSIGQRSTAPPLQEIVVDGRHYELRIRVNRYFEGTFGVGENDERLFGPLDAVVRAAGTCSQQVDWRLRTHDF